MKIPFLLRMVMLMLCLFVLLQAEAQTPVKPRIQTSAAPEETAVWQPDKKENRQVKPESVNAKRMRSETDSVVTGSTGIVKDKRKKGRAVEALSLANTPEVQCTGRYQALKTNVASDAIGVLNLAYEVQLHRKMTLDLPVMWSLWDAQREHALRVVALQPELRWWMGSKVGRGHFLGVHAHAAWFNFKWEDNRYQDAGRPLLGAGLSYGYKLPLGQHWGAEFNVGVGYANLKYNTYYNIENGALINTRIRHYWGLTRLGLSLVYRL